MNNNEKQQLSLVIWDHNKNLTSITTANLLYSCGGISDREFKKIKERIPNFNNNDNSFNSKFYSLFVESINPEETRRACTSRVTNFFTKTKCYNIIDASNYDIHIKQIIHGTSHVDVLFLIVPYVDDFHTIESQYQYRMLITKLLGIKQIIVGINIDDLNIEYTSEMHIEIKKKILKILLDVGYDEEFTMNSVPIIPYSNWFGDNFTQKSTTMSWWNGQILQNNQKSTNKSNELNEKICPVTLLECFETVFDIPEKKISAKTIFSINGVFQIKGRSDIITGIVEQGTLKPGDEICIVSKNNKGKELSKCKIFSIEKNFKKIDSAIPNDYVGLNIKGLDTNNIPSVGDIIVLKNNTSINICKIFRIRGYIIDSHFELENGSIFDCLIRNNKAQIKLLEIKWENNNSKTNSNFCKNVGIVELLFEPQTPLIVQLPTECEGLSRIIIVQNNRVCLIGEVNEYS